MTTVDFRKKEEIKVGTFRNQNNKDNAKIVLVNTNEDVFFQDHLFVHFLLTTILFNVYVFYLQEREPGKCIFSSGYLSLTCSCFL